MPELAGYPVLRTLSRGGRTEVVLAHDGENPVVVKVLRDTVPALAIARELRALDRAQGEHVVRLLDAGSEGTACCLVFEHLGGGELTGLLRDRGALEAGEVVTLLAPLAATVARLHEGGVAHGAITPAAILFTGEGSPTLVGFGSAALFPPGSPEVVLEAIPEVLADRRALATLSRTLLARVPGGPGGPAGALLRRLENVPADELTGTLTEALFGLAPPLPVRFGPDDPAGPTGPSISLSFRDVSRVDVDDAEVQAGAPTRGRWADMVEDVLEHDLVRRLREAAVARWGSWEPRRRRLVLALASAALVVVIALVAVPRPPAASESDPRRPDPRATADAPVTRSDAAVAGDDPVAATVALLELRDGCVRTASLLCLEAVVQPGSSAEAADRALIRGLQNGAEPPVGDAPGEVTLVERLGDSALVKTGPASLLLMKSEAGWRIRDYLDPPGS